MRLSLVIFYLFFELYGAGAQQVIFKNYSVKDGLASATVYHSYQDSKGFMWFGTDQGLCRFDGTYFTTYTTADGLPDNEVFNMAEDRLGRLWITCYNESPCFLQNGKIHNAENDSLLKEVHAGGQFFNDVCMDREGRVWLMAELCYMVNGNTVVAFNMPDSAAACVFGYLGDKPCITTGRGIYHVLLNGNKPRFELLHKLDGRNNSVPGFKGNACYLFQTGDNGGDALAKVTADTQYKINLLPFGIKGVVAGHSTIWRADSVLLISAGLLGIKAFDTNLKPLADPYPFLPRNVQFTFTLFDKEGNTWITSLGKGVFFIPANAAKRYQPEGVTSNCAATSIHRSKYSNTVFAGFDNSGYAYLKDDKLHQTIIHKQSTGEKRIVRIQNFNATQLVLGTDFGLFLVDENNPSSFKEMYGTCIKNIASLGLDTVLVGGISEAQRIVKAGGRFYPESIMRKRTTAIARDGKNNIWLGGLSGLYVSEGGDSSRIKKFTKNTAINNSRVTDLLCDEYGNMWVATHQRGLFVIAGDSVYSINTRSGLPGDVCVRLFRETDGVMWLCTNRHVVHIGYSRKPVLKFDVSSMGDLTGNGDVTVNDVYVDSSNIWIASSIGLLQMKKFSKQSNVAPPVYITAFRSGDSLFQETGNIALKYHQNNIQIDYVGVSFNSGGKLLYKYLLKGDTVFTTNTSLSLNALSPGEYTLRVWARNLAGLWSKEPVELQFAIMPPFWLTGWFIVLCVAGMVAIIVFFVRRRINQVKKREREKTEFNRRIAETELQAMRVQMNEHFVFNSLNSIQNFINQNNTEAANFYLSNFGKLIRRTLEISSTPLITLQEEMDYLKNYLVLEKMRFDKKFDFSVTNRITSFPADILTFPSMILQPYVENAIRHGLRGKTEGVGILHISFSEENGFIVCHIEDNGIGRKRAQELKSRSMAQHQSKGLQLSEDKVYLFNKIHDQKIRVEIIDKENEQGEATGTLVIVHVPLVVVA